MQFDKEKVSVEWVNSLLNDGIMPIKKTMIDILYKSNAISSENLLEFLKKKTIIVIRQNEVV